MSEPKARMERLGENEKFFLELVTQIGAHERRMLFYPLGVGAAILVLGMYLGLNLLSSQFERLQRTTSAPCAGSITITNGSNNSGLADVPSLTRDAKGGFSSDARFGKGEGANEDPGTVDNPVSGTPVELSRAARVSRFVQHAGLTPEEQARVDDNCPFGAPKLVQSVNLPTQLLCRDGYVLLHSNVDKVALWVCEHITKEEAEGSMERTDHFRPDPLLPKGGRAELIDYKNSGYDRGHMAPAGDQNQDETLKDETFFLSNMAPQLGDLNRKIWKDLEHDVRQWAIDHKDAYVITGGFFYDPKEDDPATADGSVPYKLIGPNAVSVPTHFYKIVVGKDSSGQLQAIAFVLQNRNYTAPWRFENKVKAIRWIEEQTGLDFMPDLSPAEAERLEKDAASYDSFFEAN